MVERPGTTGPGNGGHLAVDDLAVLALDRRGPDDAQQAHLDVCPDCAGRYASFATTSARVHGLRLGHDEPGRLPHRSVRAVPQAPGDGLWQRIITELADEAVPPMEARPARPRGRRPLWYAAAASVVLVVVAAVAIGVSRPAPTVVASVSLEALAEERVPAPAVLEDADGTLALALDLPADEPDGDAYYELWLIDENVEGMVSLGPVTPGRSRVAVPPGLDVDRYPIVDVSREPFDGDPRHSGDSLWRGRLPLGA